MKCNIPGQNVKVLGRTIHVLARYGMELYLESLEDCLMLQTLNPTESAYAMFKFNKRFFSYFNHNYYSTDNNEHLKCRISMKSALNVFKSPAHMDKQVENLEIKLDPDSCKLIFQLRCRHAIMKTHYVSILDPKALNIVYKKDTVPNRIASHQRIFMEALSNFQMSDDQVTLEASVRNLLLRNYIDETTDCTKVIRTQINLKTSEFDSYNIGVDTTITISLKEFRALLAFAEALNLPLQLHYETTGQPAVFIIHNNSSFEANFVLATTKADVETQTTNNSVSASIAKKRKSTNVSRASKKIHLDSNNKEQSCLDEDADLFNFVNIPDELADGDFGNNNTDIHACVNAEIVPELLASRNIIKNVFKRCFENSFNARSIHHVVLADNSDSE